jgi:hypothetical protein
VRGIYIAPKSSHLFVRIMWSLASHLILFARSCGVATYACAILESGRSLWWMGFYHKKSTRETSGGMSWKPHVRC